MQEFGNSPEKLLGYIPFGQDQKGEDRAPLNS